MRFAGFDLVEREPDSSDVSGSVAQGSPWQILLILAPFLVVSLWVAKSLGLGIAPDEPAHFLFIKHYASTLGFPQDTLETMRTGWYVHQNPFLYYWFNARVYALAKIVVPNLTDHQSLVIMRAVSALYSTGTLFFLYKTARLLFRKPWQQLLPAFLLANTLMFSFISGAVSYDNLANLFAAAAIYFLTRLMYGGSYARYSLLFLGTLLWGNLIKYPMTPLAFIGVAVWIAWSIKQRKLIGPQKLGFANIVLVLVVAVGLAYNAGIYGQNILRFQALTPACNQLYEPQQCALSPFQQRWEAWGVKDKPTLIESVRAGGPNPIGYFFDDWINLMLKSIYGILAHKNYEPTQMIPFLRLFWLAILFLGFRYIRQVDKTYFPLFLIMFFYLAVVFANNVNTELAYNYAHTGGLQGRYLFPVLGIAYLGVTKVIESINHRALRALVLAVTLALFIYSGPLKFALYWDNLFTGWFTL